MLRKKTEVSQGAVEFALVLPILLLIVLGIIEMGHVVFVYASVLNAAREAARYGAASGTVAGNPQYENCSGIATAATNLKFLANFDSSNVAIYYDQGPGTSQVGPCAAMTAAQWSAIGTGSRILVTVTSPYSLIVPVVPIPNFSMVSTSRHTILGSVAIAGTVVAPPTAAAAAPTITSIVPNQGTVDGGTSVVITGTSLSAGSVYFDSTYACAVTANTSTSITCTTSAHASGVVSVSVTTASGNANFFNGFTYIDHPVITSVAPSSGPTTAGTSIVITGSLFTGATSVTVGGTACTSFTVNSATQITCVAPGGSAGTVDVVVTTPGGANANTTADNYTYIAAPTITSISPNTGSNAGGTSVTITGTNLSGTTAVTFAGAAATCATSTATTIVCTTPAYAGTGAVSVALTTVGGTVTSPGGYTYAALPGISSISPAFGPVAGGTSIVITGANFSSTNANNTVTFGGVAATSCTVNGTRTTLTCNNPTNRPAGAVDVTVTVTAVGSVTKTGGFTYVALPTITSISPVAGPTIGGQTLTVNGTNLTYTSLVTVGGATCTTLTVISATQVTCTTPIGTAGAANIIVTTPGGAVTLLGSSVSPQGYSFVTPPTITTISPLSGTTLGGTSVTITGTNLLNPISVIYDVTSITLTSCTTTTATTIICPTPAHVAGLVNVSVTTAGGTAIKANGYTYNPPAPTISLINPNSGSILGGTSVVITGTNFTGATTTFGGTATTCVINSDTQMTCNTNAHAAGAVNVVITNAGGNVTATNGYTFVNAPTITTVLPSSGPTTGGTSVVITGTNLTGGTVLFGSTSATCTVNTATQITCTSPVSTAGAVNITVTTPGGTASKTNGFTYVPPAPTITTVSPTSGPTAGGTSVTITGTNLSSASSITFGGTAAVGCVYGSDTTITCSTPAHQAGVVSVVVTTLGGTGTKASAFTFIPALPTITSISPSAGPITGGTSLVITGTDLISTSSVSFGGTTASCVVNTDTQVTCTAPAHSSGAVNVVLTNSTGSVTSTGGYTYVNEGAICGFLTTTPPSSPPTPNAPPSSPPAGYVLYTKTIYNIGPDPVMVQKATFVASYKKQDSLDSRLWPLDLGSTDTITTSGSLATITSVFDFSTSSLVLQPGAAMEFYLYYQTVSSPNDSLSFSSFNVNFYASSTCVK